MYVRTRALLRSNMQILSLCRQLLQRVDRCHVLLRSHLRQERIGPAGPCKHNLPRLEPGRSATSEGLVQLVESWSARVDSAGDVLLASAHFGECDVPGLSVDWCRGICCLPS